MYLYLLLTSIFRYSSNQRLSRAEEPDHLLPKTRDPWWCNNPWPPNHQFPGWPSWCGEPRVHRFSWIAQDNLPFWNTRTSHDHRWKPQCSSSVIQKPQILYPLFVLFLFLKCLFFSSMVCYNSPWWWSSKSALCWGPICMLDIWLRWLKAGLWWQSGLCRWIRWRTLWWESSASSQTVWNITVGIDNNGPF